MNISEIKRALNRLFAATVDRFKIIAFLKSGIEYLKAFGIRYLNGFKIYKFAECVFTDRCDFIAYDKMLNTLSYREPGLIARAAAIIICDAGDSSAAVYRQRSRCLIEAENTSCSAGGKAGIIIYPIVVSLIGTLKKLVLAYSISESVIL